jgi:hypothetical protein
VDPGVTLDIKSLASARNYTPNHPACSPVHKITMLSQLAEIRTQQEKEGKDRLKNR